MGKKRIMQSRSESFRNAFKGIAYSFRKEMNLKIQLCFAAAVIILGWAFQISSVEWALLVFCISMVLTVEILNTSIELLVDFVEPDFHHLAGRIKDIATGAVLLSSIASLTIGSIIFIPKFF